MNPLLLYILRVSAAFAMFYLVYRLFLSTDTFFVRNRFYFLGAILVSLISPLLKFKIMVTAPLPDVSYIPAYAYVEHSSVPSNPIPEINYWPMVARVALILYLAGVVFYMVRFVWAYHKVIKLIITSERKKLRDLILVITRLSVSPFSLLRWLVVPSHHLDHPDFEKIVQHESIHSRQYHSVDLFLAELLVAFQWFNPFVWWIKKSMVENHEFIVDQAILRNGADPQQYQYSLVNFSTVGGQMAVVNYFNANLLKKRIRMMNKNKSPKWHGIKNVSILFIAIAVIALTASFKKVAVAQMDASFNSQHKTVLTDHNSLSAPPIHSDKITPLHSVAVVSEPPKQISTLDDLRMFMVEHLRCPQSLNREIIKIQLSFTIDQSGIISNIKAPDETEKTKRVDDIVVMAHTPQISSNNGSPDMMNDVQVVGFANHDPNSKQSHSDKAKLFQNEVENCLKQLPPCHSGISGLRYTISVLFIYEEKPEAKNPKDTSRSFEFRNVNSNIVFLRDKGGNPPTGVLYILNGTKINQSEFNSIKADEILSIEVLKDKSAIALYGEEGKNGVIRITSKKAEPFATQNESEPSYVLVEQNANFQNGDLDNFRKTIQSFLDINFSNASDGEKGNVIVQFTVDKNGNVGEPKVLRSLNNTADQQVVHAIMSGPQWKPAMQGGKPVKQLFVIPIRVSKLISAPQLAQVNSLIIFPNPASDNVDITMKGSDSKKTYEIYVWDSNGKVVYHGNKNGPTFSLSVSNFMTGIYKVVVNEKGKQYQGSLSVTH